MGERLGCKVYSLPIKYLGMPLGANAKMRKYWNPIVDKIK